MPGSWDPIRSIEEVGGLVFGHGWGDLPGKGNNNGKGPEKKCAWHFPRSARRPGWLERSKVKSEMRLERWGIG